MDDEQAPVGVARDRARVVRLVEQAASLEARVAALHAEQVSVLSDLLVDPFVTTSALDLVDELAPRMRWTTFTAARRLGTAGRLAACFPLLLEDLAGGELDYHRVDVVVREAELLDEEQAGVLDAVLTGRLPGLTTTQIKDLVRREIAVIDSDAVKERARRVVARRRVGYTALPDGEGLLEVVGPAPALRAVHDRLDALARDTTRPGAGVDPFAAPRAEPSGAERSGAERSDAPVSATRPSGAEPSGDARGIDAKRFDALVEMVHAPVRGAEGVAIGSGPQVTVAWPAAVGLDDLPAHLAGHGPVPAEVVRDLLRRHGHRSATVHPTTGQLVAVDGHVHPAGSLPDLSDPRGPRPPAAAPGTTPVGGPVTAPGAPSRRVADERLVQHAAAVATAPRTDLDPPRHVDPGARVDPGPHVDLGPGVTSTPLAGSRSGVAPVCDRDADGPPPGARRRADERPFDVPESVEPVDPGPGWSDVLGGFDDGLDPVVGGVPGEWHEIDPALGPAADEFAVTLDVERLRAATLVNPHLVHDTADWHLRAGRRAEAAVARCPASSDPSRPYRFGAALRRFLVQRSPTCAAPGCRAPAHRCDLDHTVDHARGGPTCACNANPLCRRHHTAKHGAGWCVVRAGDDPRDPALTWMSPLGYLYTVAPAPLVPPVSAVVSDHLLRRRRAREALEEQRALRWAGWEDSGSSGPAGRPGGGDGPGDGSASGGAGDRDGLGAERAGAGSWVPHGVEHVYDEDCDACNPLTFTIRRPDPAPSSASEGGGAGELGGTDLGGSGAPGAGPDARSVDPDDPPF